MNKKRNSSVELMRIVSMLMIIGHHYAYYGVQQNYAISIAGNIYQQGTRINQLFVQFILPGGIVGVGIFFMIMGYYGINSDRITILPTIQDTLFYSILGLSIYICMGSIHFITINLSKNVILGSFIPVCSSKYWFITAYLLLSIIKPALNKLILKIRNHKLIFFILLCYYAVARICVAQYLGLVQGVVYYYLGALVRLNENAIKERLKSISCIVMWIVGWILYIISNNIQWFGHENSSIISIIGITFGGSLSILGMFLFFFNDSFVNFTINLISSSTLSVYLLHENPLLRKLIWSDILKVETIQWKSPLFPLLAILSIICIFVFSILFDLLVKRILCKSVLKEVKHFISYKDC